MIKEVIFNGLILAFISSIGWFILGIFAVGLEKAFAIVGMMFIMLFFVWSVLMYCRPELRIFTFR